VQIAGGSHTLAVVIHVFHGREWEYIRQRLGVLENVRHDLFITSTSISENVIASREQTAPGRAAHVDIVPNRGRDIFPFLSVLESLDRRGYLHVLKLHTKRSAHRPDGWEWFRSLVDNVLADPQTAVNTLEALDSGIGLVGPAGHFVSLGKYMGANRRRLHRLVAEMQGTAEADELVANAGRYGFFAGTMFWSRVDRLRPLLRLGLTVDDFEAEEGQIDGTMAHAVERLLTLIRAGDRSLRQVSAAGVRPVRTDDLVGNYQYAP
jgi:lipopolysaccharide biosynthesis protein